MKRLCTLLLLLVLSACTAGEAPAVPTAPTPQAAEITGQEESRLKITVGDEELPATFADNSSAEAFRELLAQGPLTIEMADYGGFEKVGALGHSLPESNSRIDARPGDVMLYQGNQIVVFYGSNSWSYTPVGRIQGLSAAELKTFLGAGQGEVQIRLSLH